MLSKSHDGKMCIPSGFGAYAIPCHDYKSGMQSRLATEVYIGNPSSLLLAETTLETLDDFLGKSPP
jgi:hypothetical protein